jgi:hypothetical protein
VITIPQLREELRVLEEAYAVARESIEREMPSVDPLQVRDHNGQFVLLPILGSIMAAKTVIAQMEQAQ